MKTLKFNQKEVETILRGLDIAKFESEWDDFDELIGKIRSSLLDSAEESQDSSKMPGSEYLQSYFEE